MFLTGLVICLVSYYILCDWKLHIWFMNYEYICPGLKCQNDFQSLYMHSTFFWWTLFFDRLTQNEWDRYNFPIFFWAIPMEPFCHIQDLCRVSWSVSLIFVVTVTWSFRSGFFSAVHCIQPKTVKHQNM